MCTAAIAPIILTLVSTAVSAAGQAQQSRAAQQQASFQAAVARNNAIIAQRAAEDARERGRVEAGREGLRTRQLIARQRVAQAALGQVVDVGSALDLTADAAAAGRLEAEIIRNNAEREAIGFLTQAGDFQAEAQVAGARRRSARQAGQLAFLGTLVTSAGRVSDRFRRFGRVPTAADSFTGGFF